MNIINRYTALASLVILCSLSAFFGNAKDGQSQTAQLSPEEQKEYELIQKRLHDHEGLLNGACWTLIHCANEKEVQSVMKTLNLLQTFGDSTQIPKLAEAGGIKLFKDNLASLIENKDPVVRGFAALLLAVIGDTGYKKNIATLLEDKTGPSSAEDDRLLYNFDRSRAAMAMGLMGGKEYASRLTELLQSSDRNDRSGAALGLGYMGAKEYIGDISKLLSDDEDEVRSSAIESLAELDATECAKDIAKLLTPHGDLTKTACYALARLNAKEQAKEIAVLLNEKFQKGNAAKALALLGAKEYTKDIAQLIEDDDSLVRCDALIALGILDAKEYAKNVASHLQDKESYVRPYAAMALLLMGDQAYSEDIIEVVSAKLNFPQNVAEGVDATKYFSGHIKLHPVLAERQRQLTMRAIEEWKRLNQPENMIQPNSPVKNEPLPVKDLPPPKVQPMTKEKVLDNTDLLARVRVTAIEPFLEDGKPQEGAKLIHIDVLTKGVSAKTKATIFCDQRSMGADMNKNVFPEVGKIYESYLREEYKGVDFAPVHPDWAFLKIDENQKEEQAYIEHVVETGESLYKIALKYYGIGGKARILKIANFENTKFPLKVGMKLNIPTFAIKKDDKITDPQQQIISPNKP